MFLRENASGGLASHGAAEGRNHQQNEEYEEENLGNAGGGPGKGSETQKPRNQCKNEKYNGPV